jgi:transcriptional regulator with XRE-family HTH domain
MTKRPMINDALRLVRLYWGMSQQEIAETVGVSQSLVSDVEAARKGVSLELLDRYSRALGIRMSQLLFFAEELEGEPLKRRGKLFIAERVLRLLESLKPSEHAEA